MIFSLLFCHYGVYEVHGALGYYGVGGLLCFFQGVSGAVGRFFYRVVRLFFYFGYNGPLVGVRFLVLIFGMEFQGGCVCVGVGHYDMIYFFFFAFRLASDLVGRLTMRIVPGYYRVAALQLS